MLVYQRVTPNSFEKIGYSQIMSRPRWQVSALRPKGSENRAIVPKLYSYGHLPVISGYKWDYTFYKWGYKYL